MEIKIDQNHLPQDIIEDDTKFNETTHLIFSRQELDMDKLREYYTKYGREFDVTKFLSNSKKTAAYFNDVEARVQKALKSNYLRYFINDMFKQTQFKHLSKNHAKETVAGFISNVIYEACFISHKNLFKEKYMDLFETTVLDEEDLYNEFNQIAKEGLERLIDYYQNETELTSHKLFLYCQLHAKYLVEKNSEHPNLQTLLDIKEEISNCLALSEQEAADEIEKRYNAEKEVTQKNFNKTEEELLKNPDYYKAKEAYDQMEKNKKEAIIQFLKPKYPDLSNQQLLEKWKEINESLETDEFKQESAIFFENDYRAQKAFEENFNYENNELTLLDLQKIILPVIYKFDEWKKENYQYSFLDYIELTIYAYNYAYHYDNDNNLNDECLSEEDVQKVYTTANEIITFLAYCLWHSEDEEYFLENFQYIIDTTPKCKENFLKMRQSPSKEQVDTLSNTIFTFRPDVTYKNQIIISVLSELNQPMIAKKVKKIISNSNTGKKINQKLSDFNKQHLILLNNSNDISITKYHHEFAVAYLLNYFNDLINLAPFCAFIHYTIELINTNHPINIEDIVKSILEGNVNTKGKAIHQSFKHIKTILESLISKLEQIDESDLIELKSMVNFQTSLILLDKYPQLYFEISPIELLKKYQYQLIYYIDVEEIFPKPKTNLTVKDLENHLDTLIQLCINFHLTKTIDSYEKYMPKDISIINVETNTKLIQSNIQLEQKISEQNKIIESFTHMQNNFNQKKKIDLQKEIKQISSSYQKEISDLKKQIHLQEKEITKLKENETELYKLREVLFKINQENEIENYNKPEKIDYTQNLKDLADSKNIILIGGHISLIDKLKQEFPQFKFITSISEVSDLSLVNADYVFIFYNFISHALYYKIISVLSKNNITWDYIPYTNFDKTIKLIYETIV